METGQHSCMRAWCSRKLWVHQRDSPGAAGAPCDRLLSMGSVRLLRTRGMLGGASWMLWKAVQATRGALPCWRDTSGAYLHMYACLSPESCL